MKKQTIVLLLTLIPLSVLFFRCKENSNDDVTTNNKRNATNEMNYGGFESQVKWGEHLVTIGSCGDCHTPKKMTAQGPVEDSSLLLSGHPAQLPPLNVNRKEAETKGVVMTQTLTSWVGPWGISYTANLTPDSTGIGTWKEEQFIYALRNGKYKGLPTSRPLLPPMPWPSVGKMTDDELKAVFAYLKSIKPIKNRVPDAAPPTSVAKR